MINFGFFVDFLTFLSLCVCGEQRFFENVDDNVSGTRCTIKHHL